MEEKDECEDRLEGAELCLCCLFPLRPGANFCIDCGAPQGFLATALPYQAVLAEGFCYRRAVQSPTSWWTVVGIWLIFGNVVFGGLAAVTLSGDLLKMELSIRGWLEVLPILAGAVSLALGGIGIVVCTWNYLKYRSSRPFVQGR